MNTSQDDIVVLWPRESVVGRRFKRLQTVDSVGSGVVEVAFEVENVFELGVVDVTKTVEKVVDSIGGRPSNVSVALAVTVLVLLIMVTSVVTEMVPD